MNKYMILATTLLLAGCYRQSAIPLNSNTMEIDVSAASVYGRAGAMDMAIHKAAESTLAAGYDKFIVINNNGWTENEIAGGSYAQGYANANTAQMQGGSYISSSRKPEVKLIIRMYHNGDPGADKAADARAVK